jgi:hypothetical protein
MVLGTPGPNQTDCLRERLNGGSYRQTHIRLPLGRDERTTVHLESQQNCPIRATYDDRSRNAHQRAETSYRAIANFSVIEATSISSKSLASSSGRSPGRGLFLNW